MLKQRRLFWVSVGAGAASVVWLIAYFLLAYATRDDRFLNIMTDNNEDLQGIVVAAVGECRGHFKMDVTSHGTIISIPMSKLREREKICLFEKLSTGAWVDEKDAYAVRDGKVFIRPEIIVGDKM